MITITQDKIESEESRELVAEHLSGMTANSPPGHVHALALDALRAPGVSFWTASIDGVLCGCGALKELHPAAGEIKSMRTRSAFLKRGVAQALLDTIIRTSLERGYEALFLETGSGENFEAAHRLYTRNGFRFCGPFGDYRSTDFNVFMTRALV
nr:GNAT family N-acetyltransferase [Oceanococcus sp. HetDA_MAG_MS8]